MFEDARNHSVKFHKSLHVLLHKTIQCKIDVDTIVFYNRKESLVFIELDASLRIFVMLDRSLREPCLMFLDEVVCTRAHT